MEPISVRDFRRNMASSFTKVANGEEVLIRRKNEIYALVKLENDDLTVTPALERRIDEVHRAYRAGQCVTCATPDELDDLLDSL